MGGGFDFDWGFICVVAGIYAVIFIVMGVRKAADKKAKKSLGIGVEG